MVGAALTINGIGFLNDVFAHFLRVVFKPDCFCTSDFIPIIIELLDSDLLFGELDVEMGAARTIANKILLEKRRRKKFA